MDKNFFEFTYQKNRKKYKAISVILFVSIVILNLVSTFLLVSIVSLSNDILHNNKLALITFEGVSKNNTPYLYDDNKIRQIESVVFATKSRPLCPIFNYNDKNIGAKVYAIDKIHSDYVGIPKMKDGYIYLPEDDFPNATNFNIVDASMPLDLSLKVTTYPGNAPLVLHGDGFVTENTYQQIVSNINEEMLDHMTPVYVIGVDKVEHVFDVVRELNALEADDDVLIVNQANGLEGVIKHMKDITTVLIMVLCVVATFNTFIIVFVTTSLIENSNRDLMILYLNGMSREKIANGMFEFLQQKVWRAIIPALVMSVCGLYFLTVCILNQTMDPCWIMLLLAINIAAIAINWITYKLAIKHGVYKKTSNTSISKIIRN